MRVLGGMSRTMNRTRKVSVRSGNKCGKTTVAAWVALWWLTCFKDAKVIATAPTGTQVRRQFWGELRKAHREARIPLGGKLSLVPDAGLEYEDGRICIGVTTNEPERMAGYSGYRLLYIVDEASGVAEPMYEAIEGNLASGGAQLLISNPTATSGTFFDSFHRARDLYTRVHLSSFEASLSGTQGLATASWLTQRELAWGKESSAYQVRCLGAFPSEGSDQIFPLALIDAACRPDRYYAAKTEGRVCFGVDPARYGDDESVIYPRRGLRLLNPEAHHGLDGPQLAGRVIIAAKKLRRDDDYDKPLVIADGNGVGASFVDAIKADPEVELIDISGAEQADDAAEYGNMRAQVIYGFRQWLRDGGSMCRDDMRDGEMLAHRRTFDKQGRQMVIKKDEIRKTIRRSPDRSDAAALSTYTGGQRASQALSFTTTNFDELSLAD